MKLLPAAALLLAASPVEAGYLEQMATADGISTDLKMSQKVDGNLSAFVRNKSTFGYDGRVEQKTLVDLEYDLGDITPFAGMYYSGDERRPFFGAYYLKKRGPLEFSVTPFLQTNDAEACLQTLITLEKRIFVSLETFTGAGLHEGYRYSEQRIRIGARKGKYSAGVGLNLNQSRKGKPKYGIGFYARKKF